MIHGMLSTQMGLIIVERDNDHPKWCQTQFQRKDRMSGPGSYQNNTLFKKLVYEFIVTS